MANEWVPIELYGPNNDGGKRRVIIADGVSVSVGTLLQMLDPRTASYSHLAKVPIVGVAAEEHVADKGIIEISVWTDGLFDVVASGSIALNDNLFTSLQDNKVQAYIASQALTHALQMRSYETGSDAEVINIRLGPL